MNNKDVLKDIDINFIENILNEVPSNLFFKDTNLRYIFSTHYWNQVNVDKNDPNWSIKGKTDLEIRKDTENAIKAMDADRKIIETGKGVSYIIEFCENETTEYLEIIKNPVFDNNKNVIGIVGLINNITNRINLERDLERLASIDQLTNLYNRSYLNTWINSMNDESLYPLSFIFADCNMLKEINDKYGHISGDKFIIKSAEFLKSELKTNLVFRMGGDEFLCILTNTSEKEVKTIINDLHIKQNKIKIKEKSLSIAMGSSTINKYKKNLFKYINAADKNMYEDKVHMKKNNCI